VIDIECTGRIVNINTDWQTGKFNLTFEVNERAIGSQLDEIKDIEKLSIKVAKHREKRSLDSNAYCWVLLQKIAEAVKSDKWTIYLQCLQRYSGKFTHMIVKENAVEYTKEVFRTCVDLGEVTVNGKTGHQLQVYYGSSTFDSKEMSVFLDGIVQECKELGIETMTPEQIRRMNEQWQNQ
jgi:hypothetical protein